MKIRFGHQKLTIKPMLPNIITLMALCSGLTSIRMALEHKWEWAVMAILLAAIMDFMDGRIARALKVTSPFGAILDSLSDMVCFGVAPPFLVYCFSLYAYGRLGWASVMFFAICMALRLARFNTAGSHPFFVGIPAPSGALVALTPVTFYLATDMPYFLSFGLNFFVLGITGALLISRIPTYSLKSIQIQSNQLHFYAIAFIVFSAFLYTHLWLTLGLMSLAYLSTLPMSYRRYRVR